MDRVSHKSNNFRDAEEWDIRQQQAMTPEERMAAAGEIKRRLYPNGAPDVRECREAFTKRPLHQDDSPLT